MIIDYDDTDGEYCRSISKNEKCSYNFHKILLLCILFNKSGIRLDDVLIVHVCRPENESAQDLFLARRAMSMIEAVRKWLNLLIVRLLALVFPVQIDATARMLPVLTSALAL